MSKLLKRAIVLTNRIALISAAFTLLYFIYSIRNGWNYFDAAILTTVLVLLGIVGLNYIGTVTLSRFILTAAIPVTSMLLLMLPRMQHPELAEYLRSPGIYAVLLATSAVPLLVFSYHEKTLMFLCVALSFLMFASLDILLRWYSTLHELPTVGQYVIGNISLIIAYFLLLGSVLALKSITNEYETRNEQLIDGLNQKNLELEKAYKELYELNRDVETQNEEIHAQSEELMLSQESLMMANNEIERRKQELEEKNKFLEATLDEKNRDLLHTNQQLVIHNSELEQFSYTVSHNLRGPVASLLGLISIYRLSLTLEERDNILKLLEKSAHSLETIIRDLNKIIDIRHDKFTTFEEVSFDTELTLIKQSLESFLQENEVTIKADFECKKIVSTKAYINSILYNLISNGIQYRSPNRKPVIKLTTRNHSDRIRIEVSDNGLGMDLNRFGNDVFKLYKRFHTHIQGKGLGLYLVKQQVEKLNGDIKVESVLDQGTTFKISFPAKG